MLFRTSLLLLLPLLLAAATKGGADARHLASKRSKGGTKSPKSAKSPRVPKSGKKGKKKSASPSEAPSEVPSGVPSEVPSKSASPSISIAPSGAPSEAPTQLNFNQPFTVDLRLPQQINAANDFNDCGIDIANQELPQLAAIEASFGDEDGLDTMLKATTVFQQTQQSVDNDGQNVGNLCLGTSTTDGEAILFGRLFYEGRSTVYFRCEPYGSESLVNCVRDSAYYIIDTDECDSACRDNKWIAGPGDGGIDEDIDTRTYIDIDPQGEISLTLGVKIIFG